MSKANYLDFKFVIITFRQLFVKVVHNSSQNNQTNFHKTNNYHKMPRNLKPKQIEDYNRMISLLNEHKDLKFYLPKPESQIYRYLDLCWNSNKEFCDDLLTNLEDVIGILLKTNYSPHKTDKMYILEYLYNPVTYFHNAKIENNYINRAFILYNENLDAVKFLKKTIKIAQTLYLKEFHTELLTYSKIGKNTKLSKLIDFKKILTKEVLKDLMLSIEDKSLDKRKKKIIAFIKTFLAKESPYSPVGRFLRINDYDSIEIGRVYDGLKVQFDKQYKPGATIANNIYVDVRQKPSSKQKWIPNKDKFINFLGHWQQVKKMIMNSRKPMLKQGKINKIDIVLYPLKNIILNFAIMHKLSTDIIFDSLKRLFMQIVESKEYIVRAIKLFTYLDNSNYTVEGKYGNSKTNHEYDIKFKTLKGDDGTFLTPWYFLGSYVYKSKKHNESSEPKLLQFGTFPPVPQHDPLNSGKHVYGEKLHNKMKPVKQIKEPKKIQFGNFAPVTYNPRNNGKHVYGKKPVKQIKKPISIQFGNFPPVTHNSLNNGKHKYEKKPNNKMKHVKQIKSNMVKLEPTQLQFGTFPPVTYNPQNNGKHVYGKNNKMVKPETVNLKNVNTKNKINNNSNVTDYETTSGLSETTSDSNSIVPISETTSGLNSNESDNETISDSNTNTSVQRPALKNIIPGYEEGKLWSNYNNNNNNSNNKSVQRPALKNIIPGYEEGKLWSNYNNNNNNNNKSVQKSASKNEKL